MEVKSVDNQPDDFPEQCIGVLEAAFTDLPEVEYAGGSTAGDGPRVLTRDEGTLTGAPVTAHCDSDARRSKVGADYPVGVSVDIIR
jgi:hypothetical protein